MMLHVKLSTTLRECVPGYAPAEGVTAELDGGTTVEHLACKLGLPLQDIKIIMVNGRHADMDTRLADGDRVALFPHVGGG